MHDDRARRDKRRLPPRHNRRTADLHIGQGDSVDSQSPQLHLGHGAAYRQIRSSMTLLPSLSTDASHYRESTALGALTDCRATSRRRWYLPYALVGRTGQNQELRPIP